MLSKMRGFFSKNAGAAEKRKRLPPVALETFGDTRSQEQIQKDWENEQKREAENKRAMHGLRNLGWM